MPHENRRASTRRGSAEPKAVPEADSKPADHQEWLIDEADEESFPASDPSSLTQPQRKPRGKSRS